MLQESKYETPVSFTEMLWITMKKYLVILLILLSGIIAAQAEPSDSTLGPRNNCTWIADRYTLVFEYKEGELTGRLTHDEQSGDRVVWEFTHCEYVSDCLWCPSCIHYREHIDFDSFERTEEDWWMTDLSDIYFALGEEKDTLNGYGIDGLDGPLELRREVAH